MRTSITTFALLLLLPLWGVAQEQDTLPDVTITADNPVPVTTVVPVLEPPQVIRMTTTVEEPPEHLSRKERRAWRQQRFTERLDSLISSRNYIFLPNSMQRRPDGEIHLIYNAYYCFGLYTDHVEVHLPVEWGETAYVGVVNFDTMSIADYAAVPIQQGWNIRFRIEDAQKSYWADFVVSAHTAETILTLQTPQTTMRYVGELSSPTSKR